MEKCNSKLGNRFEYFESRGKNIHELNKIIFSKIYRDLFKKPIINRKMRKCRNARNEKEINLKNMNEEYGMAMIDFMNEV